MKLNFLFCALIVVAVHYSSNAATIQTSPYYIYEDGPAFKYGATGFFNFRRAADGLTCYQTISLRNPTNDVWPLFTANGVTNGTILKQYDCADGSKTAVLARINIPASGSITVSVPDGGGNPAAVEPFFFIQLSDPQFGMFANNANFVQETANFEFAVANINRLHPAFVVVTGDLVNKVGDAAQIAEYKRVLAKIDPAIPVYNVAGNHDVGNVPTPATIAAYTHEFGPDHYSFRHGDFVGIVLDSNLIQAPQKTADLSAEQERWLKSELERSRDEKTRNVVVFQHHPWFLSSVNETNQYFNLPRESREKYVALFHEFGVKHVFCGHYHRNAAAIDGNLEVVAAAPVGMPLGKDHSGMQIVTVCGDLIEHHYYSFGQIPNRIEVPRISGHVAQH